MKSVFEFTDKIYKDYLLGKSLNEIAESLKEDVSDKNVRAIHQKVSAIIKTIKDFEKDETPDFKRYVILPDVHTPFHDEIILNAVLRMLVRIKPYGIVISGDFLDIFSLSSYNQNSLYSLKKWSLDEEYEIGLNVLNAIIQASGSQCVDNHFVYGNHEDRVLKWLAKGDNSKIGSIVLPEDAGGLNLINKGFKVYRDWKSDGVQLGDVYICHGNYTNIHSAKKHLDKYRSSIMFGHTHRMQSAFNCEMESHNIGWLGDIDSEGFSYMPKPQKREWRNGFAVLDLYNDETHNINVVPILNRSFVFEGYKY